MKCVLPLEEIADLYFGELEDVRFMVDRLRVNDWMLTMYRTELYDMDARMAALEERSKEVEY